MSSFHGLVGCSPGGRGGWRISRGLHSPPFSYPHHVLRLPLTFTPRLFSLLFLSRACAISAPSLAAAHSPSAVPQASRDRGKHRAPREPGGPIPLRIVYVRVARLVPGRGPFPRSLRPAWKTSLVSRRGQRWSRVSGDDTCPRSQYLGDIATVHRSPSDRVLRQPIPHEGTYPPAGRSTEVSYKKLEGSRRKGRRRHVAENHPPVSTTSDLTGNPRSLPLPNPVPPHGHLIKDAFATRLARGSDQWGEHALSRSRSPATTPPAMLINAPVPRKTAMPPPLPFDGVACIWTREGKWCWIVRGDILLALGRLNSPGGIMRNASRVPRAEFLNPRKSNRKLPRLHLGAFAKPGSA